jgi:hypothetical protein
MSNPIYTLIAEIEPHYGATIDPVELKLVAPKVTKVEGPYNAKDELLEHVVLGEPYYYYATLNVSASSINPKQVNWAVGYDTEKFKKQCKLFSGKEIIDNRVRISISIGGSKEIKKKIEDTFKIYAYTTINPNPDVNCEVIVGNIYELVFSGTKQWGKLQTGMPTKNKILTEAELDAGLDFIGSANVGIMKWMNEDTVKGFYEGGPIGVKAVLSNTDDIQNKVINNFYTGQLSKLSFDENTQQSKKLKNLESFQSYFTNYLNTIMALVQEEAIEVANEKEIVDKFKVITGESRKDKPNFSNKSEMVSYDYYGLMGATQTIKVELDITKWTKEKGMSVDFYKVKTKMYIGDWYGADWGDVNGWESKLKGNVYSLNAFFWLQHHYGCHPFETEIIYESEDKIEN